MTSVCFPLCLFVVFVMASLPCSAEFESEGPWDAKSTYFNPSYPNFLCKSKEERIFNPVEKYARFNCEVRCKLPGVEYGLLRLSRGTFCSDYRGTQITVECAEDRSCVLNVVYFDSNSSF